MIDTYDYIMRHFNRHEVRTNKYYGKANGTILRITSSESSMNKKQTFADLLLQRSVIHRKENQDAIR